MFAQSHLLQPLISCLCEVSPVRQMVTRRGQTIQVAMTNCGTAGWVSDTKGYRYSPIDPLTGKAWPEMPAALRDERMLT